MLAPLSHETEKMKILLRWAGAATFGLVMMASLAHAQGVCTVADFKLTAAQFHNPTQREEAVKNWLRTVGPRCNEAQLKVIVSNAPTWLGTAHSPEVAAMIDGMHERRILNDGSKITEYYMSGNRAAGAPAPVPATAPGAAGAAGAAPGAAPSMVQSPPPPALPPVQAVAPPSVGLAAAPLPSRAATGMPDDPARQDRLTRFSTDQRRALQSYFDEQRKDQECPTFTRNQGGRCVSVRVGAKPWKQGEPLDNSAPIAEPGAALLERLGRAPVGYRYLQVHEDVVLVNERTMVVVDAILDLGGVMAKVKAKPADKEAPPAKDKEADKGKPADKPTEPAKAKT